MNRISTSLLLLLMAYSMSGQRLLVKSTMSVANDSIKTVQSSQPEPEPEPAPEDPTFDYPIEATIGVIPTTGTFDNFTAIQQIAVSAVRTADNLSSQFEQGIDWLVIRDQNSGGLAGNAQMNMDFISAYTVNGSQKMNPSAFDSWTAYNNWLLGVQDIRSSWDYQGETIYKTWNGTVLDFRGYKGWHIHVRNPDYAAVIYP